MWASLLKSGLFKCRAPTRHPRVERPDLEQTAFVDFFNSYMTDLRAEIVQFIFYMATPAASVDWKWMKKWTVTTLDERGHPGPVFEELRETLLANGFEPFSFDKARLK